MGADFYIYFFVHVFLEMDCLDYLIFTLKERIIWQTH